MKPTSQMFKKLKYIILTILISLSLMHGKALAGWSDGWRGQITGLTPVINIGANATLTASQCLGQIVRVTATATITLPPVVIGSKVTILSTTAAAIHVDPNAADRLILDGVTLDDGDKASSASGAGNQITLFGDSVAGWTSIGTIGSWTDGS